MDFYTEVYADTSSAGDVLQFFTDSNLTTGFSGVNNFHSYYTSSGGVPSGLPYVGRVSNNGSVSDKSICP
jgi:hypothetical protein